MGFWKSELLIAKIFYMAFLKTFAIEKNNIQVFLITWIKNTV